MSCFRVADGIDNHLRLFTWICQPVFQRQRVQNFPFLSNCPGKCILRLIRIGIPQHNSVTTYEIDTAGQPALRSYIYMTIRKHPARFFVLQGVICMRGMCAGLSVRVRYRLVSRNCKRKTRVSIARWNLKEVRSKLPARRTETAYKAYSGRTSLEIKAKSNTDRTLKCKCGGYMGGRSTHLSAEVSPERTGTKGPVQPMQ